MFERDAAQKEPGQTATAMRAKVDKIGLPLPCVFNNAGRGVTNCNRRRCREIACGEQLGVGRDQLFGRLSHRVQQWAGIYEATQKANIYYAQHDCSGAGRPDSCRNLAECFL